MNEISIEAIFLKHPTSLISDALDELNINGAISSIPQRYDQGRIAGRALPVKFSKKSSDPEAWRFGGGVEKTSRASAQNHVSWENHYNGS